MSHHNYSIAWVKPSHVTPEIEDARNKVEQDFPEIKIKTVETLPELFPILSSSASNNYDCVCIPLEDTTVGGGDAYDVIQTAITLVRCSGSTKKPQLMFLVKETTDPAVIKETSKIDGTIMGCLPGKRFNYSHIKAHMEELLDGVARTPQIIMDMIKLSKKSTKTNPNSPYKEILLTPRQAQILRLIKERGASNKVIARTLQISESTVKLHMSAILKKYGVRNRTQLALFSPQKEK